MQKVIVLDGLVSWSVNFSKLIKAEVPVHQCQRSDFLGPKKNDLIWPDQTLPRTSYPMCSGSRRVRIVMGSHLTTSSRIGRELTPILGLLAWRKNDVRWRQKFRFMNLKSNIRRFETGPKTEIPDRAKWAPIRRFLFRVWSYILKKGAPDRRNP